MTYTKPGVEITQVQTTLQPVLSAPTLIGCIIGEGYWWQDPEWEVADDTTRYSVFSSQYVDEELWVPFSGINSTYTTVLQGSLIVDIKTRTGVIVNLTTDDFEYTASGITLDAGLLPSDDTTADVRLGYLADNSTVDGEFGTLSSVGDIKDVIGEPVSWNPLAFGIYLAMINSGTEISYIGTDGNSDLAFASALDDLAAQEVYVLAPMSHLADPDTYKTHVEAQSAAAGKRERIAIMNNEIVWYGTAHAQTSGEKNTTVSDIRSVNSGLRCKRLFQTFPDIVYIQEKRHISSVHPTWINAVFSRFTTIDFADGNVYGVYALLATDQKINSILYKKGTKITAALWTILHNAGWGAGGSVDVLAPVPGYYLTAEALGKVVGTSPSQSLTNMSIAAAKRTYGAQDYFSETQLNTLAEGGTMIFTQNSPNSAVYCRHQLSTDVTSIAKRELSITTAVDYTAKFIRESLQSYIGSSNITTNFIKLVNTVLVGIGLYLVREGILADLTIVSVLQDSINPDVLNVEVAVLPLYPANYIRIKLVF